MAAETATFTPPETVTVPGEAVLETLAVLDAFAEVCSELRDAGGEDAIDDLYALQKRGCDALQEALPDPSHGMNDPPWYDAMSARSHEIAKELRVLLRGNDTLRLAELEDAVSRLGQEVIGVCWSGDKRRWLTPAKYYADIKTTDDA